MPHPSWDDPRQFIDLKDFATPVLLEFEGGGTRTVAGIFDEPYLNAELGEYDMDTVKPRVIAVEEDFAGVERGTRVQIASKWYTSLTYPQPDGTGCAYLELAPEDASL